MATLPVRFIHASDFHLERPPYGLAEIPEHLQETLLTAPYRAAQRVFDAVLEEGADFLVLSGDILNVRDTGPQGLVFLVEQFERLAERNIAVYWAGGRVDSPGQWPETVALPENVHVFPTGHVDETTYHRVNQEGDQQPVVRILGISRGESGKIPMSKFQADPTGLLTVAVAHGTVSKQALEKQRVDYLALGGSHTRRTLCTSPHVAHCAGTPQGRCPQESGQHGCTLVEADETGRLRTRAIACDVLQWNTEHVPLSLQANRQTLEKLLHQRMEELIATAGPRDLLVTWTVAGEGSTVHNLRTTGLADELLRNLRKQYGDQTPAAWSLSLEAVSSAPSETYYEEETILGDFLRMSRQYEDDPGLTLDLEPYLPERHVAGHVGATVALRDDEMRTRIFRQAATLGADLLGGPTPSLSPREEQS